MKANLAPNTITQGQALVAPTEGKDIHDRVRAGGGVRAKMGNRF